MTTIRRGILFVALTTLLVAALLLLNVTAPNPTGRRYSSEIVNTTTHNTHQRGAQGEEILAADLGVPRNETPGETQCLCRHSQPPARCTQCIVTFANIQGTHRIPDFVAQGYFAESKNRRQLRTADDAYVQIEDMATVARDMGLPLWVFVRVDTRVDPAYVELARSTGGDVVYYFAVEGYVDPVDSVAGVLVWVAAGVFVVIVFWELWERVKPHDEAPVDDDPPESAQRADDQTTATEQYMRRVERLARDELHNDDPNGRE